MHSNAAGIALPLLRLRALDRPNFIRHLKYPFAVMVTTVWLEILQSLQKHIRVR